jgi:hypothetical protein
MSFRATVSRPRFAAITAAAIALMIGSGCSRGDSNDDSDDEYDPAAEAVERARARADKPGKPFELDDTLVARTGSALHDLREAWRRQNRGKPGAGPVTVGPGIGYVVAGADAIVEPHGFARIDDFELALRHVQLALSIVIARDTFGEKHRDFDGGRLRKTLNDELALRKQARTDVERDQSLSVDERRTRVHELDEEIGAITARLEDLDSIAGNFGAERAHVPEVNVECVTRAKDTLLPLFQPIEPGN